MCTASSSSSAPERLPAAASAAAIASLPTDVLRFHILTRLDGPTLASSSCVSSHFHALSAEASLWADICHRTWPSTAEPRIQEAISAFPGGHRSFFSDSYPLPAVSAATPGPPPRELISGVDIRHRGDLIFSRAVETETLSGWFRCSPFRIDMLEPKDVVPTRVPYPSTDRDCSELAEELTLSWVLFDPAGRRAVNVSSGGRPVSVSRHWLSGEVHARFGTVVAGERGFASELVQCTVLVTCGACEGRGRLRVREVSLQVEDMDGMFLNGRDSLVILQRAMEGKRGKSQGGGDEGRRMHEEFVRRKRERKERKLRAEGTLDMLCVAFGVFLVGLFFWVFSSWR